MTPEQIRKALTDRGMKLRELAAETGISENHLTKSLSETAKKPRLIKADEMDAIRRVLFSVEQPGEGIRTVAHLGKVPAGRYRAADVTSGRRYPVDNSVPKNAYALTVDGESMNLLVDDGTVILIDPDDISLWPDNFYVIETPEGGATFKEYKEGPPRLVPCSDVDEIGEILLGSSPILVRGRVMSAIVKPAQLKRRKAAQAPA